MLINDLFLIYAKQEINLPIIVLDEKEEMVFSNEAFNNNFNFEKPIIGKNIKDYFEFKNLKSSQREDYIVEKYSCSFRKNIDSDSYYSCVFIKHAKYCLMAFENHMIHEEEVIKELSKLNIDLSNMTRELAKKNNQLKRANAEIERLIGTDFLTSIPNRRAFYERLEERMSLEDRRDLSFGVIICDIDFFKKVNDTYGHDIGDIVLKKVAQLLSENIRGEDMVARIGGEEFGILVSCDGMDELYLIAEKMRLKIFKRYLEEIGTNITASFGIAMYNKNDTRDGLIKRADLGLYKSKENGRNLVSQGS